ncbi:uncharacterized protein LOC124291194 [Haliotis rubra]|uniref:uncharacterized protein LOC124291194 n=1 Tax=Haliotis rubra TaxID=36100 RepID=UPI001EE55D2D|nr:uncharacterized protein LOC124291194 [Haliotis rubra]
MKINTTYEHNNAKQELSCSWREIQALPACNGCPRTRLKHAACGHGGQVYICSGKDNTLPLKDFWRYHLGSGTWERLTYRGTSLPHLQGHTIVSHKRMLLIFGGEFSAGTEPPLWIFNIDQLFLHKPCTDVTVPQPTSRRDHSAVMHCGIMYIYGGFVDLRGSSSELWGYHADEDYWQFISPASAEMPGGRHGHSSVMHCNSMWMFGGLCDLTLKADLWSYHFLSQKWQRIKTVQGPPPMTGHTADVVRESMVVVGGENQGQLYSDVWLFYFNTTMWRKIAFPPSPHHPLPCSQHATVCVSSSNSQDAGGDNSVRCFSESVLQSPKPGSSKINAGRPRTSPSVTTDTPQTSWVYPVRSASRNCDILTLEDSSINNVQMTEVKGHDYAPRSKVITGDDKRPLLRFVSRDSNESVGIDNVVDCTADESQVPVSKTCSDLPAKPLNTKEQSSVVHTHQAPMSYSCESLRTTPPIPNHHQPDGDTTHSHLLMTSTLVHTSPANHTTIRATSLKAIYSKNCDDLYIEDIEQQQVSPVKVPSPYIFTKGSTQVLPEDWIELESFHISEMGSSIEGQRSRSGHDLSTTFNSPLSRDTASVPCSGVNSSQDNCDDCDVQVKVPPGGYKKVLVTVATQTGSNLDLGPSSMGERIPSVQQEGMDLLDGVPYLLVFGGKVRKRQLCQQPINVWRFDLTV